MRCDQSTPTGGFYQGLVLKLGRSSVGSSSTTPKVAGDRYDVHRNISGIAWTQTFVGLLLRFKLWSEGLS